MAIMPFLPVKKYISEASSGRTEGSGGKYYRKWKRYFCHIRKGRSGICSTEQYQQKPEFSGDCGRDHDDRRVFLFLEGTFSGKKRDPALESRTCGDGNGRVLEKKDRRSFRRTAAEGYAGTCTGRKTEDPDPG